MTAAAADFRVVYTSAFRAYVDERGEAALGVAYALGRDAVTAGLGILDLVAIQNAILVAALRGVPAGEAERVAAAAGDFFLESLSAYEMVQRGFREAREAALAEKRQTTMLRSLSAFLADASLAFEGSDAFYEVLQLVAEHARELVGAGWCLATLALDESSEPLTALAAADQGTGANASSVHKLSRLPPGHATRMGAEELAADPASAALARLLGLDRPLDGRLAVRVAALDGSELGSIQLFDKDGGFTDVDEATILHLAQMAAATLERMRLYAQSTSGPQ